MQPDEIQHAAALLAEAFLEGTTIDTLPQPCRPASLSDAYRIQDALTQRIGLPVRGWKVGLTNPGAWQKYGVAEPICGRAIGDAVHASPAVLMGLPKRLVVEAEFAFTLGRDLPPRKPPYSDEEVACAIASVHPAFEIVRSRYGGWPLVDTSWIVADNGSNNGIVIGRATRRWREADLSAQAVHLFVNGELIASGTGAAVMGDPFCAVAWLANARRAAGDGLRAGQVVTSGGCLGTPTVPSDAELRATFGDLGDVQLRYMDRPAAQQPGAIHRNSRSDP